MVRQSDSDSWDFLKGHQKKSGLTAPPPMTSSSGVELPHDYLAEKSVIGCLLVDGQSYDEIVDLKLDEKDFYHPHYGMIFEVIKDLYYSSAPIDFVTVCSKLGERGKLEILGGQSAVLELIEHHVSAANVYHYAKIVKEKAVVRKLIRTSQKVIDTALHFSGETEEFLSEVEGHFFSITNHARGSSLKDLKYYLKLNVDELSRPGRDPGEISGLPTGFKELDRRLLGMQPGQLIIIAARPGMGKTSFALNLALNCVKQSKLPTVVFSLEMTGEELSLRILSSEAGIDSQKFKMKNFNQPEFGKLYDSVKNLSSLPIYVEDKGGVTLLDIRGTCRKIKAERGLGLIVIDYLQLMRSHTNNPSREQQIAEISRGLKELAKELQCPIIALSQLNRNVEKEKDKRPGLSDLRESGAIEQDADVVMMIYRDEVYYKDSKDKGIAEIIVVKNRAGEPGTAKLAWVASQTKFANLAVEHLQS